MLSPSVKLHANKALKGLIWKFCECPDRCGIHATFVLFGSIITSPTVLLSSFNFFQGLERSGSGEGLSGIRGAVPNVDSRRGLRRGRTDLSDHLRRKDDNYESDDLETQWRVIASSGNICIVLVHLFLDEQTLLTFNSNWWQTRDSGNIFIF